MKTSLPGLDALAFTRAQDAGGPRRDSTWAAVRDNPSTRQATRLPSEVQDGQARTCSSSRCQRVAARAGAARMASAARHDIAIASRRRTVEKTPRTSQRHSSRYRRVSDSPKCSRCLQGPKELMVADRGPHQQDRQGGLHRRMDIPSSASFSADTSRGQVRQPKWGYREHGGTTGSAWNVRSEARAGPGAVRKGRVVFAWRAAPAWASTRRHGREEVPSERGQKPESSPTGTMLTSGEARRVAGYEAAKNSEARWCWD